MINTTVTQRVRRRCDCSTRCLRVVVLVYLLTYLVSEVANPVPKTDLHLSVQNAYTPISYHNMQPDVPMMSAAPGLVFAGNASTVTQKAKTQNDLVNAVILFLLGGRWDSFYRKHCLPNLEKHLLQRFPYPVHVFHENVTVDEQQTIRGIIPSSSDVEFEDVQWFWASFDSATVPDAYRRLSSTTANPDDVSLVTVQSIPTVTEDTLALWIRRQKKFQGRGYRLMCRFWAGVVWRFPSLDRYEYYWRMDTDSLLTKPVLVDPFRYLFAPQIRRSPDVRGSTDRQAAYNLINIPTERTVCNYGYNKLKGENPHVSIGLLAVFRRWAAEEAVPQGLVSQEAIDRTLLFIASERRKANVDPEDERWVPMFYNNFEFGRMALKRSPIYASYFNYVDQKEPFGILQYRWGDAPLHTLGIIAALGGYSNATHAGICFVSDDIVGYRHGT